MLLRRIASPVTVVIALLLFAVPASAAHYCTADRGRFIEIRLPKNPAAPERASLYVHDRGYIDNTIHCLFNPLCFDDTEGTWLYLENGLASGYNAGGVALVAPLNATGSADTPCGALMDPSGLTATPKAGADDVVF